MSFLGPVGSLIPVKCASQLTSSGGRQVSFQDTLGKRKAFLSQVRAREWSVDIGLAKPSELSGLRWLAENVNSPMVWYGPDAVVGNILPPAQADLAPGVFFGLDGALAEVEPTVWVKAIYPDGLDYMLMQYADGSDYLTPIPADARLTVAAWLRGNTLGGRQMIRVRWHDLSGQQVGSVDTNFEVSSSWARRAVTLQAPLGAVFASFRFYAAAMAGPSVTLSDRVLPYSPGKGADGVIAHGLTDAVIRATEDQQLQSVSFTVTEVG